MQMKLTELHDLVWRRYVRMPYGHLVDCADRDGNMVIPTKEECLAYVPSILAWSTPIANSAMFGGLYGYALLEQYDQAPTQRLGDEINTLIDGLLLLCDVSKIDGFIARGVADDGVTHYPCSSNDQTGPWLLCMWRALRSSSVSEERKREIKQRIKRTVGGFCQNGWLLKNELEGPALGDFKAGDWRNCAKLLFAAAIAREYSLMTNQEYRGFAMGIPNDQFYTRREILANGFSHDMVRNSTLAQLWINLCAHLSVQELTLLDPDGKADYERALSLNAATAVRFVDEWKEYHPEEYPPFDYDWRKIVPSIKQYTAYEDILKESKRANPLYAEVCPVRSHERKTLGQALFAVWIAVTGDNRAVAEHAYASLLAAIDAVNWDGVGQCYAFVAESAAIAFKTRCKNN